MANFLNEDGVLYLWSKIKSHVASAISTKVDKVSGKGLSTNDYTTTEKNKLAGIASGAEVNVQSDWSVSDTASDAFIKNKPTSLPANGGNAATVNGHTVNSDVPANAKFTDTTYSDMAGATSSADGTHGLVPAPAKGNQAKYLRGDGTWQTPPNTTYSVFKGATHAANGSSGLVPAPNMAAYDGGYFLGADGTWKSADITMVTESGETMFSILVHHLNGDSTQVIIPSASGSLAGVMSADDKTKLDGIATGANKYVHPTTSGNKHIPSGGSSGQILRWSADGTAVWGADKDTTYSDATQSTHGLMSTADKKKLDAFGAASTYALKSDITNMYKYKGSVTDASKLPTTGQTTGDVYNIEAASAYGGAGMNVAWNGSAWDPLGEIFTITAITNAKIDEICV